MDLPFTTCNITTSSPSLGVFLCAMYFYDSDSDLEMLNLPNDILLNKCQRTFRPRINMGPDDFEQRFRLSRDAFEIVLGRIVHRLQHSTGKSGALSPAQQLLISLRFLAAGSHYKVIGDSHSVSKASVCRCIHNCVAAINDILFWETISWPVNFQQIPVEFFRVAVMPAVAGCIVGTHVRVESPIGNEQQYVNRHDMATIRLMSCVFVVLTENFYVSARWPGAVNDARVLRNSTLFQ